MKFFLNSPLEQFEVTSLASIDLPVFGNLHFSLTNLGLYVLITLFLVIGFHVAANNNMKLVPSRWSISLEASYASIHGLVKGQLGAANEKYFPLIYALFFFLLFSNLTGNVPYSFTVGSSLVVCLGLSMIVVIGVTILGLSIHKLHFFSFFLPAGTPLALVPVLAPIELISYVARSLSLGVRLLANLAAGHSLMKILGGFLFTLFTSGILVSLVTVVPFAVFVAIVALEVAVSFIQSYVFCILTASYLKDAIDLH
nr:ATP synthase F0 subunit a [Malassezia sp.]